MGNLGRVHGKKYVRRWVGILHANNVRQDNIRQQVFGFILLVLPKSELIAVFFHCEMSSALGNMMRRILLYIILVFTLFIKVHFMLMRFKC